MKWGSLNVQDEQEQWLKQEKKNCVPTIALRQIWKLVNLSFRGKMTNISIRFLGKKNNVLFSKQLWTDFGNKKRRKLWWRKCQELSMCSIIRMIKYSWMNNYSKLCKMFTINYNSWLQTHDLHLTNRRRSCPSCATSVWAALLGLLLVSA